MARVKSKSFFGLVLMASLVIVLAVVLSVTNSNKSLFSNSKAYVPEPCKVCLSGRCQKIATYPNCYSAYNECSCSDGAICSVCGGSGGGVTGGTCTNGTYKCTNDGSSVRKCIGSAWGSASSCPNCHVNSSGTIYSCVGSAACTNNTYKCGSNGNLKKCVNSSWVDQFACPECRIIDSTSTSYYCRGVVTTPPPPAGTECTSGTQKCSGDRTRFRSCVNGYWIDTPCKGCIQLNSGGFTCNG